MRRHFRSLAPRSARTYRCALERFDEWRRGRAADDDLLAEYLESRFADGKAHATLRTLVAAVKFRSKKLKQDCPAGEEVAAVLKRTRREGRNRQRNAVPLLKQDVDALLRACDSDDAFKVMWNKRDAAAILLGFNAGLRVLEVRHLEVRDVLFREDGTATLHIRFSKVDQEGRGAYLPISAQTAARIRCWLEESGITGGPLFPAVRYGRSMASRASVDALQAMLKRRLQQARLPRTHTWHDLRRGMASQMTLNGAPLQAVQAAGRWDSPEMVLRYCQGAEAVRGSANTYLFGEEQRPTLRAVK